MLLQLETTNQVFMNTNSYNSLYHTTLREMACNKKVIICGFKPLQVFNRLNSRLSYYIFNTCACAVFGIQQSCNAIFHSQLNKSRGWCPRSLIIYMEVRDRLASNLGKSTVVLCKCFKAALSGMEKPSRVR